MTLAIEFFRIQNSAFEGLNAIKELYETAFPENERRKFQQLLKMLHEPDIYFYAVKLAGSIVGFCIFWQLNNLLYLEHLAIQPNYRGRKIGQQMMHWLLQKTTGNIVLEVERPVDDTTRNRIKFYQQIGFTLHTTFDYYQPPYERNAAAVPLYLMSWPHITSQQELARLATIIKQHVYERFYS